MIVKARWLLVVVVSSIQEGNLVVMKECNTLTERGDVIEKYIVRC